MTKEMLRSFYESWGETLKSEARICTIAAELNDVDALVAFNAKLRSRFHGTDLSTAKVDIEKRRAAIARIETLLLPLPGKPITFDPRFCVAPMVGQSDLAFRLLCRRHGATCAWTEMLYSRRVVEDDGYLSAVLQSCAEDRPLIVQICGNHPETMAAAAAKIEEYCNTHLHGIDAIDVNLGCPQKRAQEEHYGSYLLDRRDWDLVASIVEMINKAVKLPVTAKLRLLQTETQTVDFARRLQWAGASLLTVHGRQRGSPRHGRKGPANLAQIAAVKRALQIPVISNGNVTWPRDVLDSRSITCADGVMSAEGILANPILFEEARELEEEWAEREGLRQPATEDDPNRNTHRARRLAAALEYLELGEEHNIALDVQSQHISHVLGLSAATQGVSWAQRKALVQSVVAEQRERASTGENGDHSSCLHENANVCAAADIAAAPLPPPPLLPPPLRMRQMKSLLSACRCSRDLRDLVRQFLDTRVANADSSG
jgi:tRNA-dihydrouridine synthase 1